MCCSYSIACCLRACVVTLDYDLDRSKCWRCCMDLLRISLMRYSLSLRCTSSIRNRYFWKS